MSVIVATLTFTIIAPYMITFQRAGTAATQLFSLIDRETQVDPFDQWSGERPADVFVSGEIDMQNITFSYPTRPEVAVLDDYTLKIPAGRVTALVVSPGTSVHYGTSYAWSSDIHYDRALADQVKAPLSVFWSGGTSPPPEQSH